jgi:hypothetical protein
MSACYSFESFASNVPLRDKPPVAHLEAVQPADTQVIAATSGDLDILSSFPAVESVVAKVAVKATRDLPHIRELLIGSFCAMPDAATLRHLPGLHTLFTARSGVPPHLELEALPAARMRKLGVNRWTARSLEPLHAMTNLTHLYLDVFGDPLDAVPKMPGLVYAHIKGPAKGWAGLCACTKLQEAIFIDVQIANFRRWNTWRDLRTLALAGRGIKSIDGLDATQSLEKLTLINMRMESLTPLRKLPNLHALTLRMASEQVDLDAIAHTPKLRSFILDSSVSDSRLVRIPTLKPLARLATLEEITLRETLIEDGSLMPLAELPGLRKVSLGSEIGADVGQLRAARPDLEIFFKPLDPKWEALKIRLGHVIIRKPGEGLTQWSIFQSLAHEFNVSTNYAAETRIKREIRQQDPQLARRLDWDTEAGNVGIYTEKEEDIRTVADIINQLVTRPVA